MVMKNSKITKKFYVGAERMANPNNDWAHATLVDAINHAKDLMSDG